MKRHLAVAAFYTGSALAGLAGAVFFWVALAGEPADGAVALWLLAAGTLGAAGGGLRAWSGRYYFP